MVVSLSFIPGVIVNIEITCVQLYTVCSVQTFSNNIPIGKPVDYSVKTVEISYEDQENLIKILFFFPRIWSKISEILYFRRYTRHGPAPTRAQQQATPSRGPGLIFNPKTCDRKFCSIFKGLTMRPVASFMAKFCDQKVCRIIHHSCVGLVIQQKKKRVDPKVLDYQVGKNRWRGGIYRWRGGNPDTK